MSFYPPPNYKVTKTSERPFPWWRRTCEILISTDLKEGQLSRVIDGALNIIVFNILFTEDNLLSKSEATIETADAPSLIGKVTNISSGINNPLLVINGNYIPLEAKSADTEQAFEIKLTTNFLEFSEDGNIIFTVTTQISPPDEITFSDIPVIGRLLNITPKYFGLSVGFYRTSFISASLGAVPEMLEGIDITATVSDLKLRLWSESLPRGIDLPLTHHKERETVYLSKIQEFLKKSLGEGINFEAIS